MFVNHSLSTIFNSMDINWNAIPPSLEDLLRGYATVCPTRKLGLPDKISFDDLHHFLLNIILLNPFFEKYPPSTQYQSRFWKWAIENLENKSVTEVRVLLRFDRDSRQNMSLQDDEIDERILSHHVELMSKSSMYAEHLVTLIILSIKGRRPPAFNHLCRPT